jgi:hypothetical protein
MKNHVYPATLSSLGQQMAIRASSIVVGGSFALLLLSASAEAGHVQSWLDSRGGCSPGPLQLMGFNAPRGLREFLGKQAQDWTDEDVDEFQRVYSACAKRYPVTATNVLNATAMVLRKPQNIQILSLDKSVPETAKLPYGRVVKAFDISARPMLTAKNYRAKW